MQFTPMAIPDVILIEPKVFGDERGFFMETWNARSFAKNGLNLTFVQDITAVRQKTGLTGQHWREALRAMLSELKETTDA